jgi:hypothetical protein
MRRFATTIAVLVCGLTVAALPAEAQNPSVRPSTAGRQLNWGEQMFEQVNYDFGTVARGADVVARIKITNKYVETIHLRGAHTSCGCISARLLNDTLKTWETGILEIRLNTVQFSGQRNVTAFVEVDQPAYLQVAIPVSAFIRTDVSVTPGSAILGNVAQGDSSNEQRLQINYAGGQANWRITDVKSRNPNVLCSVRETGRQQGYTNASYELSVKLSPNAPVGDLREQIVLVTNDVSSPQIPVMVEGRVIAEFSITPPSIVLKGMKPGEKIEQRIVIRGQKPFAVEKIESNSGSEAYQVKLPQKDRYQIVQILNVIINAPEKPGPLEEVFTVTVAGQSPTTKKALEFKLNAKVVEDTSKSAEPQTITTAKPPVTE